MGYVSSLFARKMVAAAGAAINGAAFLRRAGVDPEGAWDPKAMIPDGVYYDMLEGIAAEVDVTELPLRVGASMRLDEYGALGLFILHCDGERRLGMRLSNEATLASAISIARQVSPVPVAPLEVLIRHSAPHPATAHEEWFGAPIRFEADLDGILFSREALAQPNILGDAGISGYLATHLERELSEIADEAPLVVQTRDAIAQALSEGAPKMAEIARDLGLSARSFHRRLSEHGLSFQTLTEETRRDLAEGLLRDGRHSLAEIAFLTGFAEQSSFTRAFKRWVGMTPASYRNARVGR